MIKFIKLKIVYNVSTQYQITNTTKSKFNNQNDKIQHNPPNTIVQQIQHRRDTNDYSKRPYAAVIQ